MPPCNRTLDDNEKPSSVPSEERRRNFVTHLSMDEESARSGDQSQLLGSNGRRKSYGDLFDDFNDIKPKEQDDQVTFFQFFLRSSGPPQIILLCLLLALAFGSTVGVVPAVVEDRYARLRHGYDGDAHCLEIPKDERPHSCLLGNEDAQNSSAIASFISNALTFITSSMMGSISDEYGRKGILLLGIGLSILGPLNLVLLQLIDNMNPLFYYACHSLSGAVSWMAVALSVLSDVIPPLWRAPSFGFLMAGFSCGFAFSPILAVFLSHRGVSILSLGILVAIFIFAALYVPETLSLKTQQEARVKRQAEMPVMETRLQVLQWNLKRPAKELLILNRNTLFRLMSALAFFSGVVSTVDHTLFLYYVEENYDFGDKDIALLFVIIGLMGIFVQTVVLKPLNSLIGERLVIVVSFSVGALHNFLYGIAETKRTIFFSAAIASLTGMSFPTISAIKANNVNDFEQGRIQGALYSVSSLASAVGPMMMRYVYHKTRNGGGFGKGTMFIFGSGLYVIATLCAWWLPDDKANSNKQRKNLDDTPQSPHEIH